MDLLFQRMSGTWRRRTDNPWVFTGDD